MWIQIGNPVFLNIKQLNQACICDEIHFNPTALKGSHDIVFTHGVRMGVRADCGKKFVQAVSQKPQGVGCLYLVGPLVKRCRCATSRCDLDFTIHLAIVTLSLKSCPGSETIRCRKLILGMAIRGLGVQHCGVTLI